MTRIIANFAEIAADYDAAFVDLWGCMHNGLAAFPEAVSAMQAYRAQGGRVILVTNAPRPRGPIEAQVERLGIPRDAWDAIATSGDAARMAMFEGIVGGKVWFMGEPHDLSFFEPPRILANPVSIERVDLGDADGIVCLGPSDSHADPEVNRPAFADAIARGLKLLCANPDIIVDRGESREWCAGALARLYEQMGGTSLYFGKPHGPIYDLARARLAALEGAPSSPRIIAVGDGIGTDIAGAVDQGIDSLFVTGGLAAFETRTPLGGQPEADALATYVAAEGLTPTFAAGFLR